jgi:DNA polymerase-3 subunit delta'
MIIWMVEKLFHAAAPKILKILEEPPDKTLFILIAEQSDLILPTILSRTQLVKFDRRSDNELMEALMQRTKCREDAARKVMYISDGNLNKAIKIIESGETEQPDFEMFRSWMRLCFKKDIQEIFALSAEFHKMGRERQKRFFGYCLKATRYCILNQFENTQNVRAEGEELEFIRNFSPFINKANVEMLDKAFNEGHYHIERNGSANMIFSDISLRMTGWLRMK